MNDGRDFKKALDSDFIVFHRIDDAYSMDTLHFHDVFEIYLSKTEGLRFFVDNRIYPVERNDLFVFNHLDLHRIGIPPGTRYERYIIVFRQDYIGSMCTGATDLLKCFLDRTPGFQHRVHLSDGQAQTYLNLIEKASGHMNPCRYGEDVLKKITLAEILIFVNSLYHASHPAVLALRDAGYGRVKPVLDYINANLCNKLSLDHLAKQFFISKYHLCKLFKEVTGFTVKEYVIYRRIIRATELLNKNLPVTQVAGMTGFQNDSHFITTFKEIVGTSPKKYARRDYMLE